MAQTTVKMRQIAGGLDGWIPAEQTWTYASATTITVPSGAASRYQKGDKIKITNNSATKYFYIVGVADTVLTVTGGSDYTVHDSAITLPYYSHVENPIGFPHWFNYTLAFTGFSTNPTGSLARFSINGRVVHLVISAINGTSNAATMTMSLPVTATSFATIMGRVRDNNIMAASHCYISSADYTVVAFGKAPAADGGFTTSGTKGAQFEIFYEI